MPFSFLVKSAGGQLLTGYTELVSRGGARAPLAVKAQTHLPDNPGHSTTAKCNSKIRRLVLEKNF